jgi:hypothetical protein
MAPEEIESPPAPPPPDRYAISAPSPVTGGVQGVAFANGQAIAAADRHGHTLDWFRQAGYSVVLIEADPAPADDPEPAPEPADPEPTPPAPDEEPPDEDDPED